MAEIPKFLNHLPVYKGLPVPWVAAWSDEMYSQRAERWMGCLWLYNEQRTGTPDFGSTNSHRQRKCMLKGLCQVCGDPDADTYVVPDDKGTGSHRDIWREDKWILNPPLHRVCFDAARSLCPHLVTTEPLAIIEATHRDMDLVAFTASPLSGGTVMVPWGERAVMGKPELWRGRELIVAVHQ